MEEHAEPVVREPIEAMAAALDLLDEEVEAFGGPFEAPVSWCARISVPSDEGAASSGWSVRSMFRTNSLASQAPSTEARSGACRDIAKSCGWGG